VDNYGNTVPIEEIMVALAGPIQHIWMLIVCKICYELGYIDGHLYSFLFWNNISIFSFNLLPIWPLDGGKVLLSVLLIMKPFKLSCKWTLCISSIVIGVCILIIVSINPTNITMWSMVGFLLFSLWNEWRQQEQRFIRFILNRYRRGTKASSIKRIPILKSDTLRQVVECFYCGYRNVILIEKNKTYQTIDEGILLSLYFKEKKAHVRLSELMK